MSELVYYRNLDEQLLVFPILGNPVGIELKYVKSISLITELIPIPRSPKYILGIVNIDTNIYPVIDLDVLLTGRTPEKGGNKIISLIDIGNSTFGVHTHNLPQVIPGTAEKDTKTKSSIPKDWILGFTKHPELGKIPVINPREFWVSMGENEVIGPSLEDMTTSDLYKDTVPDDTENITEALGELEDDINDEEESYKEENYEAEEEVDEIIAEAETLADEIEAAAFEDEEELEDSVKEEDQEQEAKE